MKTLGLKKLKMPDRPGVYFFYEKGKILYIGKATSLKSRVRSYFGKDLIATRGPIIVDMVFKAKDIKWQETDSVLEALILEANLIKKHQPYYNTKEKDDKSFNYVGITKELLPKVVVVRGRVLEKKMFSDVYGPYPNGNQLKEALKIIRKIFPFYDDKSKNYKEFYRQIELAPNTEKREEYIRNIRNIKLFLSGKKSKIITDLKREMKILAKEQKFERAGEIKRQIFALEHINDVALIKEEPKSEAHTFRIEAYDIAHMSGKNMVGVMTVVESGQANKNEYRKFKIKTQSGSNDTGALLEVLERRLGHPEWRYPNLIVVDGSTAQINVAMKLIKNVGMSTPVVAVTKDERHRAKDIKGDKDVVRKHEKEILLANSEAHRFAIKYHKDMRNKNFLK
ncbi:MAG: GIY-YIG nuclease family protein [Candidatus Pacebacteria bacterium]|nr:GIY-YIG nuclease family protein [Candidatus Paceibacterota bacterium]